MNRFLLIFLIATSAVGEEPRGPFYSPIRGFSQAILPILDGFEKAKVETTLRGFIARADSAPGFSQSEEEPSEYGLYLNVAVCDSNEISGFSDHKKRKGTVTHRFVEIPPPKGGKQAIVIELEYGRKVHPKVIQAIDNCINGVVRFSKKPTER